MNIPPRLGCAVFTAGAKWHVEAIPTPCSLPTAVGQERKKADPTSKDEGQPKCFHNGIILIVICLKFYLQRQEKNTYPPNSCPYFYFSPMTDRPGRPSWKRIYDSCPGTATNIYVKTTKYNAIGTQRQHHHHAIVLHLFIMDHQRQEGQRNVQIPEKRTMDNCENKIKTKACSLLIIYLRKVVYGYLDNEHMARWTMSIWLDGR